jgi:succinate dehydrogenase / fumarate reductase cytochrome b subunit
MSWIVSFYRSAVGKKAVMAVTGVCLFVWILFHMLGNLKLYLGPEHFNEYAAWLRTMGAPAVPHSVGLWVVRIFMLLCIYLHIDAATRLTLMNWAARPVAYRERDYVIANYASRTMRWGGVIILLFIIYHLGHLTWGWKPLNPGGFVENDPYHNVVVGFRVWWASAIYIVANLALGLHLFHGLWSMFNSVGLNHVKFNPWKRVFATAFAVVITLGNISFPIMVLAGVIR